MPQKFFNLVKTRIFKEFLKIVKSALFQTTTKQKNHLKKSGYSTIFDIFPVHCSLSCLGYSLLWLQEKKMLDKWVVFGCNNRPNKEKGVLNFVSWDWWHGEAQKKKEVDQLRKIKVYSLETHKILGGVFETCPRLLRYVFWLDYVWFWRKVLEGWYWDLYPRNLYFYRKQTSQK